jgi:hypothetical protein
VSELQLRLDAAKDEAGANRIKLQALVAEWQQVQATGGSQSLPAGRERFSLRFMTGRFLSSSRS